MLGPVLWVFGLVGVIAAVNTVYGPQNASCPSNYVFVRQANGLDPRETTVVQLKAEATAAKLTELLHRLGLGSIDLNQLVIGDPKYPVKVGTALSGGGVRAALLGGGNLAAMDERVTGTTSPGQIGGLLQASTYLSALSGGGITLASVYFDGYTNTLDLRDNVWGPAFPRFESLLSDKLSDGTYSYQRIAEIPGKLLQKRNAGFPISLADVYGMIIAQGFMKVNFTTSIGTRWSDLSHYDFFTNLDTLSPYPIMSVVEMQFQQQEEGDPEPMADQRVHFEVTPFEIGSWNKPLAAFADLEYLGSDIDNGKIKPNGKCVTGYDSASLVVATSADILDELPQELTSMLDRILASMGLQDLANERASGRSTKTLISPNPFLHFKPSTKSHITHMDTIQLMDGGFDGQVVPLEPLLKPERGLDVIFAFDNQGPANGWTNLISLNETYRKFSSGLFDADGIDVPFIPSETGADRQFFSPIMLGCDLKEDYDRIRDPAAHHPLIVYIPAAPYNAPKLLSPTAALYDHNTLMQNFQNAYNVASGGNSTATHDKNWSQCVGCSILKRSMDRQNVQYPDVCRACFDRYCLKQR